MSNKKETVRTIVWNYLHKNKTKVVFGNPGSTELPFFANWPKDVTWVMGLHEGTAIAMATGYAQATGQPTLVVLHSAAGVANALSGIYTATRNYAPLVVMAGQQVRSLHPTNAYLYAEQATVLPQPYVKWALESSLAENVPLDLARAYHLASQKPYAPTFLSIPMDDWDQLGLKPSDRIIHDNFTGDTQALVELASQLQNTKNPVIVVGPEVDRDHATELAVELAERIGAKVWLSPHIDRHSFPEEHPSFRGQLQPLKKNIKENLKDADFVLVLGAPVFLYHLPGEGKPLEDGIELVQLTEDPALIARAELGTGIRTSIKDGLITLLKKIPSQSQKQLPKAMTVEPLEVSSPMTSSNVLKILGDILPEDTIIVEEAPTIREIRWQYLPVRKGGAYFNGGSGSLGWGLPAAMGISMAKPNQTVVCIVGDGSLQYAIQSLWTAAQHNIKLLVIVLNNQEYAAMKELSLTFKADNPPSYSLPGITITDIVKGYGCHGNKISTPEDLAKEVRQALDRDGTTVLDVTIDATIKPLYN